MFDELSPDIIIHLAAKVGGIIDNIKKPAEYYTDNVLMNTFLMHEAHTRSIERFVAILSTCIYPDVVESYPIKEEYLHLGAPADSNFSYAYAKRSLAVQIEAYNKQYGKNYQYLIPCNLYGEFDKYGENSHFIAALIKKIHQAKISNQEKIVLFGDGTPKRQFMHSDDFASILKRCIEEDIYENMNVAIENNLSITEMANIALKACDAEHLEIEFDHSYPNGQMRKDVSVEKMKLKFPDFQPIDLMSGIKKTYNYLIENKIL
jgi:GDP-L-fucose synthase